MRCRRRLIIAGSRRRGGRLRLDDRRHPRGVRLPPHVLCVRQLVVFLVFHPPVLKPDLDLPLGECKGVRNLNSTSPCQVAVEMELLQEKRNVNVGILLREFLLFPTPASGVWCRPSSVVWAPSRWHSCNRLRQRYR